MKGFDDFLKTIDMKKLILPTADAIEDTDNFAKICLSNTFVSSNISFLSVL